MRSKKADISPYHVHILPGWPLSRQALSAELSGDEICRSPLQHIPNTILVLRINKMPSKSKEKRPARITIACNACRSRKQKCSGRKPICEQCLDHNRPCNWPKQLRRGPEKGYAEALENRLQLTENILLNLLPHVSDEQLSDAIPRENSGTYMPFPRLEKRGIENWSQFPLDTPQGIRRWQEACTEPERVDAEMQGSKRRRLLSVQMSTSRELDGTSNGTFNGSPNCPVSETADNTHEGNATVERMSSWQGAPSFEFQRQFLW